MVNPWTVVTSMWRNQMHDQAIVECFPIAISWSWNYLLTSSTRPLDEIRLKSGLDFVHGWPRQPAFGFNSKLAAIRSGSECNTFTRGVKQKRISLKQIEKRCQTCWRTMLHRKHCTFCAHFLLQPKCSTRRLSMVPNKKMRLRCVVTASYVSFFVPSSKFFSSEWKAENKERKKRNLGNKTKQAQNEYVNTII